MLLPLSFDIVPMNKMMLTRGGKSGATHQPSWYILFLKTGYGRKYLKNPYVFFNQNLALCKWWVYMNGLTIEKGLHWFPQVTIATRLQRGVAPWSRSSAPARGTRVSAGFPVVRCGHPPILVQIKKYLPFWAPETMYQNPSVKTRD